MLDLSPEKLVVLLAVGLTVLGPKQLPGAARALAHLLVRARRLTATLTEPITTALAEPVRANFAEPLGDVLAEPLQAGPAQTRRAVDDALAGLRAAIAGHPLVPTTSTSAAVDPSFE